MGFGAYGPEIVAPQERDCEGLRPSRSQLCNSSEQSRPVLARLKRGCTQIETDRPRNLGYNTNGSFEIDHSKGLLIDQRNAWTLPPSPSSSPVCFWEPCSTASSSASRAST